MNMGETNHRWNHQRSALPAELASRMMRGRDPYTVGHQRRVTRLARAIAEQMALGTEDVDSICLAASLHDCGKSQISGDTLSKPGKLNDLEWATIQSHAREGYKILDGLFSWPVAEIVLQHHERLDGSGYPEGVGEKMLMEARVLAVADVVEAMSSRRPYRAALGLKAALNEVEGGKGTRYDTRVVVACLEVCDHRSGAPHFDFNGVEA